MQRRAILKTYQDTKDRKALYEYGELLSRKGWNLIPIKGGYLSPDNSTLFVVARFPYNGQLLQYCENKEKEYTALVDELVKSGEFAE